MFQIGFAFSLVAAVAVIGYAVYSMALEGTSNSNSYTYGNSNRGSGYCTQHQHRPQIRNRPNNNNRPRRRRTQPAPDEFCSICIKEFVLELRNWTQTPCDHFFHTSCINTWSQRNKSCPNCRKHIA